MKKYEIDQVRISEKPLVRDMRNKALLNTDRDALTAYRDRQRQMEEIKSQKQEINTMKSDLQEIKQMLSALLEKR
jgi:hypothetical protein